MTRKLPTQIIRREVVLTSELRNVLESGHDVLGYFPPRLSKEELLAEWRRCWEAHGGVVFADYVAKDSTTRPAGWWYFDAPVSVQIESGTLPPLPTEQRTILLANGLLDGAAKKLAQDFIADYQKFTKENPKRPGVMYDIFRNPAWRTGSVGNHGGAGPAQADCKERTRLVVRSAETARHVVCDSRKNKSMREGNQNDKIDARRFSRAATPQ